MSNDNIIKTLRESNSLLLKAEGADLEKWSKLKHVKEDFELFLQFNIAEIEYKTLKGDDAKIICTNNPALIKIIQTKELKDKQKFIKLTGKTIRSKDKKSILAWDIIDKNFKTISLKSWQINNFISITQDNILILDELLKNI